MKTRPTSITAISWILIVIGGLSLMTTATTMGNPKVVELMSKSPIPVNVQYVLSFAGLAVSIASGLAMLQGCNWGRYLYAIWGAIGMVIGLLTSPMKAMMLPGLLVFIIICIYLFRPAANEYFTGADEDSEDVEAS